MLAQLTLTITTALNVSTATVERIRKRFVVGGVETALNEQPRSGAMPKLDGKGER